MFQSLCLMFNMLRLPGKRGRIQLMSVGLGDRKVRASMWGFVIRRLVLIIAALAFVFVNYPVIAQNFSTSSVAAEKISADTVCDVFASGSSKGPYVLSWTAVQQDSETVICGGKKLLRGNDYTIDYSSGIIAFNEPQGKENTIRVTYKLTPGKSTKNTGAMNLPLDIRLLDSNSSSLDVIGFYKQEAAGTNSAGLIGLVGSTKIGMLSKLDSVFLMSKASSSGVDTSDISALRLAATTSLGGLNINASYSRAGSAFVGGEKYGFSGAGQTFAIAGGYGKLGEPICASFSYREIQTATGTSNAVLDNKVIFSFPSATTLTLARSVMEGKNSSSGVSLAQIDQKIGSSTTVTALVQESNAASGGSELSKVSINTSALKRLTLAGSWVRSESSKTGESTSLDFTMKAGKQRNVLDAGYSMIDSDSTGYKSTAYVRLAASVLGGMGLRAGYRFADSERFGNESGFDINLAGSLIGGWNLVANLSQSETSATGTSSAAAVRVSGAPLKGTQVQAGIARTDSEHTTATTVVDASLKAAGKRGNLDASFMQKDSGGILQESKAVVRFDASLIDTVSFRANMIRTANANVGDSDNVDLMVRMADAHTKVEASFSQTSTDRTGVVSRSNLRLAANPIKFIDIYGDYSKASAPGSDTSAGGVTVGVTPLDGLRVEAATVGRRTADGSVEQRDSLSVIAQPIEFIKLTGSVAKQESGGVVSSFTDTRIDFYPDSAFGLTHTFTSRPVGGGIYNVRGLAGYAKIIPEMEISGAYKTRHGGIGDSPDTKAFQLALGSSGPLRIAGTYALNPEDTAGKITTTEAVGLNVNLNLGVLGLTGGLTQRSDYVLGTDSKEQEVGLSLKMFGHGKLTTSYKMASLPGVSRASEMYRLGYTHIVGPSFSLTLAGELNRSFIGGGLSETYGATASLGMRF